MSYALFTGDTGQKARLSMTERLLKKNVEPLIYMTGRRGGSERETEHDGGMWRSCCRHRAHTPASPPACAQGSQLLSVHKGTFWIYRFYPVGFCSEEAAVHFSRKHEGSKKPRQERIDCVAR